MFDLTRLGRILGFSLVAYMLAYPGFLLVAGVLVALGSDAKMTGHFLTWPLPWVFPVLSVVLIGEMLRRLQGGILTTTQVSGYRMVAVLLTFGSSFATPVTWHPLAVAGAIAACTFLPLKRHAASSTWTPS